MNNENEVMEKAPVLTKKDCVKGAIRWSLMAVTTFNYDTQLAPAVVFGIGPLLRKIYKDDVLWRFTGTSAGGFWRAAISGWNF